MVSYCFNVLFFALKVEIALLATEQLLDNQSKGKGVS